MYLYINLFVKNKFKPTFLHLNTNTKISNLQRHAHEAVNHQQQQLSQGRLVSGRQTYKVWYHFSHFMGYFPLAPFF